MVYIGAMVILFGGGRGLGIVSVVILEVRRYRVSGKIGGRKV